MAAASKPLHHNISVDREEKVVRMAKRSRSTQCERGVQIVLALHRTLEGTVNFVGTWR